MNVRPAFLIVLIFVASCATVVPPSGGPPDTEAPSIIETEPANGSTRFTGNSCTIRFSEYVDRQSVESNLFVSPIPPIPIEFDWSGKSVTFALGDSLAPNTTYVVTIGSDARDRYQNKMSGSFSLAFSTGDSIDRGVARFRVHDKTPAGVSIFAYKLSHIAADTLNPSTRTPEYQINTSSAGTAAFSNIVPGSYRFIAVRDKLKNSLYDVQSDDFGVLSSDVVVTADDSTSPPRHFSLTIEDTAAPSLQSVDCLDNRHLLLKFSERPAEMLPTNISVLDSTTNATIGVIAVSSVAQKLNHAIVTTAVDLHEGKYFLTTHDIPDHSGNRSQAERSSFIGLANVDSSSAGITNRYPSNNDVNIAIDSAFSISFSDAVTARDSILILRDSTGAIVLTNPEFISPSTVRIAHPPLQFGMKYTLCLAAPNLTRKTNGRRLGDSALCITFSTISESEFGSVEGVISDSMQSQRDVIVELHPIESRVVQTPLRTKAKPNGSFALDRVPQGKYFFRAFVDGNGNHVFDAGKPFPFRPSERFGLSPDTVKVRARWSLKGVTLKLF